MSRAPGPHAALAAIACTLRRALAPLVVLAALVAGCGETIEVHGCLASDSTRSPQRSTKSSGASRPRAASAA